MGTVLLVDPAGYRIERALNQLTDASATVSVERSVAQHQRLKERYEAAGWTVHVLPATVGYPDAVFVSNAALVVGSLAILSRFSVADRRGEEEALGRWFRSVGGYQVVQLPEEDGLYFEGLGDCRWSHNGRHLWIGYGTGRTTRRGAIAVRDLLRPLGIEVHPLHIQDRRTYHLDLCLCPLPGGNRAMWHAGSFTDAGRTELSRAFKQLINVPLRFLYVCNGVILNDRTMLIPKIADARPWLRAHVAGARFEETNVNEFQLAGGAVSCLSLILSPSIQSP
jgi:N-dimethylarginine dimethylaminohydrolase